MIGTSTAIENRRSLLCRVMSLDVRTGGVGRPFVAPRSRVPFRRLHQPASRRVLLQRQVGISTGTAFATGSVESEINARLLGVIRRVFKVRSRTPVPAQRALIRFIRNSTCRRTAKPALRGTARIAWEIGPYQNRNFNPNWIRRGLLTCELTTPNWAFPRVVPGGPN
jgi:hypothetical protein